MYVLNSEVVIKWELLKTSDPLVLGDLDLIYISPLGDSIYEAAPISNVNYIAPTEETSGLFSKPFTPNVEGLWKIRLVTGNETNFQILSTVQFIVFDNSTSTPPINENAGFSNYATKESLSYLQEEVNNIPEVQTKMLIESYTRDSTSMTSISGLSGSGIDESKNYLAEFYIIATNPFRLIFETATGAELSNANEGYYELALGRPGFPEESTSAGSFSTYMHNFTPYEDTDISQGNANAYHTVKGVFPIPGGRIAPGGEELIVSVGKIVSSLDVTFQPGSYVRLTEIP